MSGCPSFAIIYFLLRQTPSSFTKSQLRSRSRSFHPVPPVPGGLGATGIRPAGARLMAHRTLLKHEEDGIRRRGQVQDDRYVLRLAGGWRGDGQGCVAERPQGEAQLGVEVEDGVSWKRQFSTVGRNTKANDPGRAMGRDTVEGSGQWSRASGLGDMTKGCAGVRPLSHRRPG